MLKGRLFNFDKELFSQQLKFSLPIGIASVVGVITTQLDKIVISAYFSPELFAIFSVGAAELPFIGIITNSINAVLLPAMSGKTDRGEILEMYRGAVRKNALILLPIFAYCFVFAPYIIHVLYSAKYLASVPYFRIYLLSMPLRIATYGIIFQVFDKTKIIFGLSLLTLALNIVCNLLFIRLFGLVGPAFSAVLAIYFSVFLSLVLFKTQLHISLRKVFPMEALFRILISSLLSGALSWPLLYLHLHYYYILVISFVCFVLFYMVFGSLLGAILPYDRQLIFKAWSEVKRRLHGTA
jgi:O-antigen/teichoic acid export membrane protein